MRFVELHEDRLTVGLRDRLKKALPTISDDFVRQHVEEWIDMAFQDAMNIPTYGGYGFELKYAMPLGLAIHAVTDEHMREFLTHWTFDVFGDGAMPLNKQRWDTLCSTGTLPKPRVPRPSPFATFSKRYDPIPLRGNEIQRDREQIPPGTPETRIWSVISPESGRGADVIMPGVDRHAHSFIVTRVSIDPNEHSGLGYYF